MQATSLHAWALTEPNDLFVQPIRTSLHTAFDSLGRVGADAEPGPDAVAERAEGDAATGDGVARVEGPLPHACATHRNLVQPVQPAPRLGLKTERQPGQCFLSRGQFAFSVALPTGMRSPHCGVLACPISFACARIRPVGRARARAESNEIKQIPHSFGVAPAQRAVTFFGYFS